MTESNTNAVVTRVASKRSHYDEPGEDLVRPKKTVYDFPSSNSLDTRDGMKNDISNETTEKSIENVTGFSSVVAAHYNSIEEKGLSERNKSRIFYLRNFNNWMKSMLIMEYLKKIRESITHGSPIKVLDMCCGKGGDLFKWQKGNIRHLICADIAATSVEQCKIRYDDLVKRNQHDRVYNPIFSAEFITADCTEVRLRGKFQDPSVELDLVSCQFSFHYSFESLPQAERMLQNASECLKPGGYFIGTMPNAADIVHRIQLSNSNSFGNEIFKIEMKTEEPYPLFGAKYDFYLEGVVNCPEFLVHFPTLIKIAGKCGLKLVDRQSFQDFYVKYKNEGRGLLERMQALETYPPFYGVSLAGKETDYRHADEFIREHRIDRKVGTISQAEWDAISLYQLFVFRKQK